MALFPALALSFPLASDSLVRDVIYDDWGAGYVFITVTSDTAIKLAKGSLVAVGQQRHKKPFAVTRFPVVSKKKYEYWNTSTWDCNRLPSPRLLTTRPYFIHGR